MIDALIGLPKVLVIASLATLPLKAFALWKSARLYHRYWFVALFVINTLGILDAIYLLWVVKKSEEAYWKENENNKPKNT